MPEPERDRPTELSQRLATSHGGGEGTRTLDLRLAKPPLFQLSYTPGAEVDSGVPDPVCCRDPAILGGADRVSAIRKRPSISANRAAGRCRVAYPHVTLPLNALRTSSDVGIRESRRFEVPGDRSDRRAQQARECAFVRPVTHPTRVRTRGRTDLPRHGARRGRFALAHGGGSSPHDSRRLPLRGVRSRCRARRARGGLRAADRVGHRAIPFVCADRRRAPVGGHTRRRRRPCHAGQGGGKGRRPGDPDRECGSGPGRPRGRRSLGRATRRAQARGLPAPFPPRVLPQHHHGQRRDPDGAWKVVRGDGRNPRSLRNQRCGRAFRVT